MNIIKLYDFIKSCYLKAANKCLELDTNKCNNYSYSKNDLPSNTKLNITYGNIILHLNDKNTKIRLLSNLLQLTEEDKQLIEQISTNIE